MKQQKIKRYRLSVSQTFPMTHPRKGGGTNFTYKIFSALGKYDDSLSKSIGVDKINPKLHTIRGNYPLWEKRMAEVQAGRAVIELFYWDGKPYRSPQVVFATLDKNSGCGVQELDYPNREIECETCDGIGTVMIAKLYPNGHCEVNEDCPDCGGSGVIEIGIDSIAKNDGLSLQDFNDWFKKADLNEPMAIIHFTKFRY